MLARYKIDLANDVRHTIKYRRVGEVKRSFPFLVLLDDSPINKS
jgi:hypothetical protein